MSERQGRVTETDATLSVVIPVWNRADSIVRTLDSVMYQDGIERCHLIIVDNDSTDGSAETIESYFDRKGFANRLPKITLDKCIRRGAAAARNVGLESVDTEWVMHFDSDDTMRQGLIRSVLDIADGGDADVVTWAICQHLDHDRCVTGRSMTGQTAMADAIVHGLMSTQRYACRMRLIKQVGGWNESCRGWDDLELGLRILLLNPRIVSVDKILADTFISDNSITESQFSTDHDKWEHPLDCMSQVVRDCDTLTDRQKVAVEGWIDYRRITLAADYAREGDRQNSRRLYRVVTGGLSLCQKMPWRMIYLKHRLLNRGTGIFARMFLARI